MNPFNALIQIDALAATPKYLQIAQCIMRAIASKQLSPGDAVPSINELSIEHDVARDTVEKAYRHLKGLGIIDSVPRKSYYISTADPGPTLRIFMLFNKLSEHKKKIYDAFAQTVGNRAIIDLYIYHNDVALFKRLLEARNDDHTHYVVIPHFMEGGDKALEILGSIAPEKLVLVDKLLPKLPGSYAAAYENFEEDIYGALSHARAELGKYQQLWLIFPELSYYPPEIIDGFNRFCKESEMPHGVLHTVAEARVLPGDAYITVMEQDLLLLLEKLMETPYTAGTDVGIISYNEIPVKKFLLNGITTISTDFEAMGRMAAEMVLSGSRDKQAVPFKLTKRDSL